MKLKVIISALMCLTLSHVIAQQALPNAGFELGNGTVVSNWMTTYDVQRVSSYNDSIRTISAFEGNYFLKLVTRDTVIGGDPKVNIPEVSVTIGYAGHPDSIAMSRIYFPRIIEDNYQLGIEFLKWFPADQMSYSLLSKVFNGDTGTSWSRQSFYLNYNVSGKPDYDSLRVFFRPTNPGQHDPNTGEGLYGIGTTLLVDQLSLSYNNNTGISNVVNDRGTTVFPNPARSFADFFYIPSISSNNTRLEVLDINGRLVVEIALETAPGHFHCDVSELESGLYFYRIVTDGRGIGGRLLVKH